MTPENTECMYLSSCCMLAWWSSTGHWQRLDIQADGLLILYLLIHNNRYCGGKKPPISIVVTFLGQVTCKGMYDRVACDNKSWIHWFRHFLSTILMNHQKSSKRMIMGISCSYAFWVPWKTSYPLETTWNPREHLICGTSSHKFSWFCYMKPFLDKPEQFLRSVRCTNYAISSYFSAFE